METVEKKKLGFLDLGLSQEIINGLKDAGLSEPSPIQIKAIPLGKDGKDLVVHVTPGTGKTTTFTVLSLLVVSLENKLPQVLILSPTRDIARLTCMFLNKIGKYLPSIICQCFMGGTSEETNNVVDCQICTGTPDRLKKLIEDKHLNVSSIKLFVINELEMMIEKGYYEYISWISTNLSSKKQTLIFGAKFSEDSQEKIKNITIDPIKLMSFFGVKIYSQEVPPDVPYKNIFDWKFAKMVQILKSIPNWSRCLIYIPSKEKEILNIKLKETEYPFGFVPPDCDNTTEKKNQIWQSIKKTKIIIVTNVSHLSMFDMVNLVFCLGVTTDNSLLQNIGSRGSECVNILIGMDREIQETTLACDYLDMEIYQTPSIIPPNFYVLPKKLTEYAGVTVPQKEIVLYLEIAKKARNISRLMETESWTHPRQQDISRKIRRWRQELVLPQTFSSPIRDRTSESSTATTSPTSPPTPLSTTSQSPAIDDSDPILIAKKINTSNSTHTPPSQQQQTHQSSTKVMSISINVGNGNKNEKNYVGRNVKGEKGSSEDEIPQKQLKFTSQNLFYGNNNTNKTTMSDQIKSQVRDLHPEELYDPHYDRQHYVTTFVKEDLQHDKSKI